MKTQSLTALLSLGFLTGSLVAGCSDTEPADAPTFEVARSSLARDTNPVLSAEELGLLQQGQATFAVDVLKAVTAEVGDDKNVVLSPYSITTALGMTFAGAAGETAVEMKKGLRLDLPDERVHAALNHLDLALSSRGQNQPISKREDGSPRRAFQLKTANSFWGQKTLAFEAPFLDTLATQYGSGVNVVDFAAQSERSRLAINDWVANQTEKRIKDLLPKNSVDGARAVLVNAIYFNASWAREFSKRDTADAPFTKLDGSITSVPTMNGDLSHHVKGEGFEAVSLPYFGNEVEMLVIVPSAGSFRTFESSLTGARILEIMAGLEDKDVRISFPKLKIESAFRLADPLEAMGMHRPFHDADFTRMSKLELKISQVFHNTFLSVDEEGTEAAAATAVVMAESSGIVREPTVVKVDRPFITAIVDRATKTLLFIGRIVDPK